MCVSHGHWTLDLGELKKPARVQDYGMALACRDGANGPRFSCSTSLVPKPTAYHKSTAHTLVSEVSTCKSSPRLLFRSSPLMVDFGIVITEHEQIFPPLLLYCRGDTSSYSAHLGHLLHGHRLRPKRPNDRISWDPRSADHCHL